MADMQGGNFAHDAMPAPKNDLVMPLFSLKGRTAIVSGAGAGNFAPAWCCPVRPSILTRI